MRTSASVFFLLACLAVAQTQTDQQPTTTFHSGVDLVLVPTIVRDNAAARIVLVSVHGDHNTVERGLAAGALGFVLKLSAGDDLVPAIHAALRGERHVSGSLHHERELLRRA